MVYCIQCGLLLLEIHNYCYKCGTKKTIVLLPKPIVIKKQYTNCNYCLKPLKFAKKFIEEDFYDNSKYCSEKCDNDDNLQL